MELPSKRQKRSRIDSRYRSSQGEVSLEEQSARSKESVLLHHQEEGFADEPLLIRERKGRRVMGRGHRMFHRRQAEGAQNVQTGILTVIVDVIATVDSDGNTIGRETLPPTQQAITAAAVPTVPAVPAVPAFPSDLTVPAVPVAPSVVFPSVPAYPFPSGVPTVQGAGSSSQPVISPSGTSSIANSIFPTVSSGYNSTSSISSTTLISSSTTSTQSNSSTSTSSSSSSTSSSESSSSLSTSSSISSSTTQHASTTAFIGGGGANTAAPPAATNTANSSNTGSGNGSSLSTPKVVGSVIGSLAGAAILLVFLLLLLRWHKRKQQGVQQLGNGTDSADNQPIASSGQQMSESKRMSFAPMFSRFSGMSRSTADTSTTGGERGFQRISGRKLPSAFSEGMTSDQFAPREGTLSESSFYRDETGFYGGPGAPGPRPPPSPTSPPGTGAIGQKEKMMPSPARTPIIHHPDDAPPFGMSRNGGNTLSPPHSPNPDVPPRGTLGRSHPSHDGSRGSKFTEDV